MAIKKREIRALIKDIMLYIGSILVALPLRDWLLEQTNMKGWVLGLILFGVALYLFEINNG